MYEPLMTLLFFPDWTNGLPSDFLILHFFVGAIIFPFNMIHAKARKIDSQNPQEAANGYKNSDATHFWLRRNQLDFNKSSFRNYLIL